MFGIRDPRSGILDPEKIHPGSRIPDPWGKKAPDPGSRIRIRIRNTENIFGSCLAIVKYMKNYSSVSIFLFQIFLHFIFDSFSHQKTCFAS
jgi:hypothetical protein